MSLPHATPAANNSSQPTHGLGRQVRAVFVSDVHLGSKHSQADLLLQLLCGYHPQQIYVVGDFIDGWKLKRRWRWHAAYDGILQRLLTLRSAGTQIYYAPGNHDAFLRNFLADYGVLELSDRFVHVAADGRRFLVMHGDQFDKVEQSMQWLSLVGTYAYDLMLSTNYWINFARGKRHNRYAFSGMVKRRIKGLVRRVSDFEAKLVEAAAAEKCFGIICGHIHAPRILQLDNLAYINTGDWVENCTALVELNDGTLRLLQDDGKVLSELPPIDTDARPEADVAESVLIA